jgi:hypothetical protein
LIKDEAMRAIAVPRFEAGAEGIHLAWTWPDLLPLSLKGYDIQRRAGGEDRREIQCETIDRSTLEILITRAEYPALLGPLLFRRGAQLKPIDDPLLHPPATTKPVSLPEGIAPLTTSRVHAALSSALALSNLSGAALTGPYDVYTQELLIPANWASVTATAKYVFTVALSRGKVVAAANGAGAPIVLNMTAQEMDTIVVYALVLETMEICVARPAPPQAEQAQWQNVPYIVKGLTLPIHEADPALSTPAAEYAAAKARLIGGETLTNADFSRMVQSMRLPAKDDVLGRSGERIVLVRATADQSFEELAFEAQISALGVHPESRRVLGFGFADRQGLQKGVSYEYRVIGRFHAEDVFDDIYDVHLAPASTPLPVAFSIRDLQIRLGTPGKVVLDPPPPPAPLQADSRRGIQLDGSLFNLSWLIPDLAGAAAILDLPRPVNQLILEVAPGHTFKWSAGDMWLPINIASGSVPPGPKAQLNFPAPITQLRLFGRGTLHAVRLQSGKTGEVTLTALTTPVVFAPLTPPAPPPVFTIYNLQQPPTVIVGPIDETTPVPPRPPAGFRLNWIPPTLGGVSAWPDDLDAGPPLDALAYQIEHRTVQPPSTFGPWEPIAGGDNLSLGSRDGTAPAVRIENGMDVDQVYPRIRPRSSDAGFALHLSDVFGQTDPATGQMRLAQPFGSFHQYQIRSVDVVGRPGTAWTPSNIARLEKHIPPPMPVGPPGSDSDPPPPVDANNHLTAPPGPKARAIVAGARGLTPDDLATLGSHHNAILLEWGWRQHERDLDPTTAEFRVYVGQPQDVVTGTVTGVTSVAPNWALAFTGNRNLSADECAGQWITCGGYPFLIITHGAGATTTILVEPAQADPSRTPTSGPVVFGRPLQPAHQRPSSWDQRVAIYPLTANANYRHVFYDLLTLNPGHPRDTIWVGVSAADAQNYIPDELTSGANSNRPGNESSIAACTVSARYQGQPVFDVPPPLGDVPEQVTEEPTGRQVLVSLDLTALLGGALPAGALVALERCSADDVISRLRLNGGTVVLNEPDGTATLINLPNPNDQAAVIAALQSSDPQRLANRYALYALNQATDPEGFFSRIGARTVAVGPTDDRLPPKPGRFFYRVRAADVLGHVSAGGATLPVVVRVPSTAGAATPRQLALTASPTGVSLKITVPADQNTTYVLLFVSITPPGTTPGSNLGSELLRIPNRRDLYPHDGLRLRLPDGTLLPPTIAKNLSDPDVVVDASGSRVLTLVAPTASRSWLSLWCYGLTRDGFPSPVCGPVSSGVPSP